MLIWEIFAVIYLLINIMIGILGTTAIAIEESTYDINKTLFSPKDFFCCVFMYQKYIWNNTEGTILVGRILLIVLSSIFVICLNIINFVVLCLFLLGFFIVACFNFVFGKKHEWRFLKALKKEWKESEELNIKIAKMRYEMMFEELDRLEKDKEKTDE